MNSQEINSNADPRPLPELIDIAKKYLGVETLETQKSDAKDFHDLAVWSIRAALAAAFEAGQRSGSSQ